MNTKYFSLLPFSFKYFFYRSTQIYVCKLICSFPICRNLQHASFGIYPYLSTLAHFFKLVAKVGDWFKEMQMVRALAESLLDPFAASSFCSFVERELDFFMGAEEFLNLEEYAVFQVVFGLDGKTDGEAGLDRLSLHANRVIKLMSAKKYRLRKSHKVNILRFLGDETIPADLRNKFRLDLARLKNPLIRRFVKSPKFTEQFLSSI